MVLDYSKWDALELSDDSDFEPHPNVDKRSFIRAKQNQIHMQRAERKQKIEALKYDRVISDGLLRRVDTLLAELRSHEAEAKDRNAFLYQALITSAGDPDDDEPPRPPASVNIKEDQPRYSQMMGSLVDQVKKEVDEANPENWIKEFIKGVDGHRKEIVKQRKERAEELIQLEKEESRKITSESIHDGFNASAVTKEKAAAPKISKGNGKMVEVLNPAALKKDALTRQDDAQSSGADADIEEGSVGPVGDIDDSIQPSEAGKEFGKIKIGDYRTCAQFISQHPEVLAERETDGLLIMGFHAEEKGNSEFAKQCVHQALLLQYCRSLGPDGVRLFFKRITTKGHNAQKVFHDDVNATYQRMKVRTAELAKEHSTPTEVETIQLQAVEPGSEIHFNVPQPHSTEDVEKEARAVFESFPPGLQRALESGSLDRINDVLAKMSVEEAEEIVGQLGESGMLDMRQGVIDTTTAEGKEQLKLLHEHGTDSQEDDMAERAQEIEVADPD